MSNLNSEPNRSQDNSETFLHSSIENSQKLDGGSLSGYKAFDEFIRLAYNPGDTAWFKFGHKRFAVAQIDSSGYLSEIWETTGTELDREKTKLHPDGYKFLSDWAKKNDGGIFYIPGKPEEFPLKSHIRDSNDIGAEMDDGTAEEQEIRISLVEQLSGLDFTLKITSGGKSQHPHYILTESVDID